MTTRQTAWLAVPLVAIAVAIYYPHSPGGRQRRNIDAAERHIALIRPRIADDPRFAGVDLATMTADGGGLIVIGDVASPADVEALHAIVYDSLLPFAIKFAISTTQPATRPTIE